MQKELNPKLITFWTYSIKTLIHQIFRIRMNEKAIFAVWTDAVPRVLFAYLCLVFASICRLWLIARNDVDKKNVRLRAEFLLAVSKTALASIRAFTVG